MVRPLALDVTWQSAGSQVSLSRLQWPSHHVHLGEVGWRQPCRSDGAPLCTERSEVVLKRGSPQHVGRQVVGPGCDSWGCGVPCSPGPPPAP